MNLSKEEQFVRDELAKIYDQLVINCQKTCGDGYERWGHDLLPMTIEMFLEKKVEQQLKVIADGKLENFITFMMGRQLKSTSSRFWHHYRKDSNSYREYLPGFKYNIDPEFPKPFEDEDLPVVDCIKYLVEKFDPFEKMVYNEHIIEKKKYVELSEKYDIPYYTFKVTSDMIKQKLKKECQHLL